MWVDSGGAKVKKVAPFRELAGGTLDIKFVMALLRVASGAPKPRSVMLKYLGKDIQENDLLKIAEAAGKTYDQRSINHLAMREAARKRIRAREVLLKVCHTLGLSGSDLDYGAVEAMADKITAGLKERRSEIEKIRNISWNTKAIKRAVEELERLTSMAD